MPKTEPMLPPRGQLPVPLTLVVGVLLGLLSGVSAILWHAHVWAGTRGGHLVVIPWGSVVSSLAVFAAAVWWGLASGRRWAAWMVGALAFVTLGVVSFSTRNVLIAPFSAVSRQIAPASYIAALTLFIGVIVATITATVVVVRVLIRREREELAVQAEAAQV